MTCQGFTLWPAPWACLSSQPRKLLCSTVYECEVYSSLASLFFWCKSQLMLTSKPLALPLFGTLLTPSPSETDSFSELSLTIKEPKISKRPYNWTLYSITYPVPYWEAFVLGWVWFSTFIPSKMTNPLSQIVLFFPSVLLKSLLEACEPSTSDYFSAHYCSSFQAGWSVASTAYLPLLSCS